MTDENIVIGIKGEVEGGKVVKRVLDDIVASESKAQAGSKKLADQFGATDSAAKFLTRTMQTLGAAFGLRQLQQTVDVYTNIQNRLKLVTGNTEELTGVTNELFRISNDTRQAFESTAEVYTRVALATKELGLSQKETLQFTESLNQAVVLSGASAAESAAGLIQLSQGLASGTLRGDELRSVLEQLPAVADVIAKSLGVTRGELRKMGEDGKITADIVIDAFKKAREELAGNFAKTTPTIGQAFVVLQNQVIKFVGELDKASGVSGQLAKLILITADAVDVLTVAAAGALAVFGAWKVATAGLVALLSGPAGMLIAVGAIASTLVIFRDEFRATGEYIQNVFNNAIDATLTKLRQLGLLMRGVLSGDLTQATKAVDAEQIFLDIRNGRRAAQTDSDIAGIVNGTRGDAGRVSTTPGIVTMPTGGGSGGFKDAQKELKGLIKETSTEAETLKRKLSELEKLKPYAKTKEELEAVNRAQQIYNEQLKTASDTIPVMDSAMDRLVKQTDKFAESAASAFKDFVTGAKSGKEALSDLVSSLYQMVIQETITSPLSDLFRGVLKGGGGGGGLLSGIQSAAGSLFGSIGSGLKNLFGFDSGGSMILGGNPGIDKNVLALNGAPIAKVGRGETLSISPSQSGGGASIVVNQVINVSTGVAATVAAELQAFLPKVQESTIAAVRESQLRGIT